MGVTLDARSASEGPSPALSTYTTPPVSAHPGESRGPDFGGTELVSGLRRNERQMDMMRMRMAQVMGPQMAFGHRG
ncbi:MAG: hypothetical protein Q8L84_01740 [Hyphomonas sp.]|nr:hypothetical protein [Hyphomonas sp.]